MFRRYIATSLHLRSLVDKAVHRCSNYVSIVVRVHPFELLGSSERKWGVAGVWKIYPVELQDRARLHFPYTSSTYYHVESVLQKRLKRQDHPLLIVSIYIYNSGDDGKLRISFLFVIFHQIHRPLVA